MTTRIAPEKKKVLSADTSANLSDARRDFATQQGKRDHRLSEPGRKLLARYVSEGAAGNLIDAKLADGSPCRAMKFGWGDNSQKVCGERLHRQGFAITRWSRFGGGGGGLLIITDAGRAALSRSRQ